MRGKVALALVAVYLIWGSTYLALRFALESFPPFLMGGVRYTLAGLILLVIARRGGAPALTWADWRGSLLVGTLLFSLGNGLVGVAEHTISSGVAAVVVATTSLWSTLFAALWGTRPTRGELLGLVLGLCGVVLLQRGGAFAGSLGGTIAIVLAPIAWALGSILSAQLRLPAGSLGASLQMIAGGVVMLVVALLTGERIGDVSPRAVAAFGYLVVFGSFIAFSAYRYLLLHTRPALATSYAFVNPAIALLLGAALAGEVLTPSHLYACLLTAAAVLCVMRARAR